MKIAITGGAGFIGSHLTRAYLDAGHDVFVIDTLVNGSHAAKQSLDSRARLYNIDIRDGKLSTLLQRERPDIVSHHAAQREPALPSEQSLLDADLHVRGLLNVLDACISASVSKFIFASAGNSLYACAAPDELPVQEDAPLCPKRPGDITKVAGEWYVRYYTRQYRLTHTILRYADVYGDAVGEPFHHPLSYFVQMLLEQQRPVIRGPARARRDAIFIDDVVRANLAALHRGTNSTLHISSGQAYDLNQFYFAAAQLLQSDLKPVYVSGALAEPSTIALDNRRAQQLLAWRPEIPFTEGVRRVVEAYAERAKYTPSYYLSPAQAEAKGGQRTELPALATALA